VRFSHETTSVPISILTVDNVYPRRGVTAECKSTIRREEAAISLAMFGTSEKMEVRFVSSGVYLP
jgi:hypothetical protein